MKSTSTLITDAEYDAELISLVRSKGQDLTEHTLRTIHRYLKADNVSLAQYVEFARPHFQNPLKNSIGFLLSRAKDFKTHSQAAPLTVRGARTCALCQGKGYRPGAVRGTCPGCNGTGESIQWKAVS